MESVKFHGVAMGGKIYSLRMAKGLTQEQLAAVLNISPAIVTLTAALAGASGGVVVAFMRNLADRLRYFISEDIDRWNGTEEEILKAQRRILELGSFCLMSKDEPGQEE